MQTKIKAVFTLVPSEKLARPLYRRIGTAFVNADDTLNVVLDALPVSGRLHIRDIEMSTEVQTTPIETPCKVPEGRARLEAVS